MYAIGAVTAVACASKIAKVDALNDALKSTGILPSDLIPIIGPSIIFFEIACVFGLIVPKTRVISLFAAACFYGAAAVYSLLRLRNGATSECGCFPGILLLSPLESFVFSLGLFATSLACAVFPPHVAPRRLRSEPSKLVYPFYGMCILVMAASGYRIASIDRSVGFAVPGAVEISPTPALALTKIERRQGNDAPTLFVFTDLDCPGCKQVAQQLRELSSKFPELKVEIHHLPLIQIHPDAFDKAVLVEACRLSHRDTDVEELLGPETTALTTWRNLDQLFNSDAAHRSLIHQAEVAVRNDLAATETLGLTSTPSVIVKIHSHSFYFRSNSNLPKQITDLLRANSSLLGRNWPSTTKEQTQ